MTPPPTPSTDTDDSPPPPGPAGLLGLPLVVLDEALGVVPRLLERTRRQVDVARSVASHVPCLRLLSPAPPQDDSPLPAHEDVPVDVLSVVAQPEPDRVDGAAGDEGRRAAAAPEPVPSEVPPADELPVPDYDALSASQVVPRLAALERSELEAVQAYERAHRKRQTILNRVAQLLEG